MREQINTISGIHRIHFIKRGSVIGFNTEQKALCKIIVEPPITVFTYNKKNISKVCPVCFKMFFLGNFNLCPSDVVLIRSSFLD